MSTLTKEQEEVLTAVEETAGKILDQQSPEAKAEDDKPKPIGEVVQFPTITEVAEEELRLTATISGTIYDASSRLGWENSLNKIPGIQSAFPASEDKQLYVRFLNDGVTLPGTERLNIKTPFTAVITGKTMVLGWRGTFGLFDGIADIDYRTTAPWNNYPDLLVQGAFWDKVKDDLDHHKDQITNYITGHYMKDLNKMIPEPPSKPDGTAIKRILLTGHSLGGGLAQLAHVALTLPGDDEDSLSSLIKEYNVEVRTLVFSAPMSIALSNFTSNPTPTADFLKGHVEPMMHNFVYDMDVVPRGYANLTFINSFIDSLGNDINNKYAKAFIKFKIMADKQKSIAELTKYRHMGKLICYNSVSSLPKVLFDKGFPGSDDQNNFHSIKYRAPEEDVVAVALTDHMALVMGPGMSYPITE